MSIMIIPDYAKSASTKTKNYTGAKAKLSKLEYKNGGYIVELKNRTKSTDVPTLVISLGGLGGKTLNKIKERYIKSINDEKETISFLAIDTSESDLNAIRKATSEYGYLDDSEYAMVASHLDPALIDIVLNTKNDPSCPQYRWMDKNIPDSTRIDTNGAQCRRQIGRLMLSHSTNYDNLLNKIKSKIHDLSQRSSVVQSSRPLNVILVAGISGGTGSGTVVDISYMIRLALALEGGINPLFDAIIYTPDVQFSTPAKRDALQRNFVAAMKEIDAFMEACNAKEKYTFPCGKFPDGEVVDGAMSTSIGDSCSIFDSCTLVQAYDAAGGSLSSETVIDNVTNYVVSLISDAKIVDKDNNPVQLSRAIFNNKDQFKAKADDLKKNKIRLPRDVYYRYNAMGYSAVKFPVEEIVTIMANRTAISLIDLYDKAPVQEVSAVLSTAGLIPAEADTSSDNLYDTLFEKGANASSGQRIVSLSKDLTFNDIKGDDVRPSMNNVKIQNIKFETDWISNVYDNVVSALKEEMKTNGPFAAKRLSQRILDFIGSMINRSAEICQIYEKNYKDYESKANSFKKDAQELGKLSQLFGGNKKEEITTGFINAVKTRDLYYWKNRSMDSGEVRTGLTELSEKLHTLDTEMYERYVGAFTAIAEILQNDSAQQLNASVTTDAGGKSFSANMLNIAEMNDENSRLSQVVKYYLTPERIKEMSDAIIRDMMDNAGDWTGTTINDFNAVENMKTLFKNQFKAFLDSTIEKFLVVKYTEGKASVEDVCDAIDKIINNGDPSESEEDRWRAFEQHCETQYDINPLQKAAEEIFKQAVKVGLCATPESAGGMTNIAFPDGFNAFYNYEILCLMESTPNINKKIQQLNAFKELKKDSFVCGVSKGSEVTYLKVVSCLPIYYFKGMLSHQEVYAKCLASGSEVDAGMHMDCGIDAPWKEFSPLCSNLTIEAVHGKAQALTRTDYQAEDKILANIKKMADFCELPEIGFIESSADNAVLSFIDKELYKDDQIEPWENKLLDNYRKKVEEAASGIEVPGSIVDADSFWEKAFAEKYNTSLPSMKALMMENGYIFAEREIKAAAISLLPVCGKNSHGDYNDVENAESGSFYKNIRRSTETRRRLKSIYDIASELKEKMETVKEKVTETAKNNALESFRSGKNAMLIEIMIQAVLSGYISLDYDKDSMALNAVMVDSLSDGASVVSAETFRYAGKRATELKYVLFGAFAAWFLNVRKDDEEWWNVYRENVTDTFSKNIAVIKTENRKEKILALMPEKSDEIKYESVLTRATVYQKINSAFESEKMMSSAYSVPIDTTMLSAAKDDVSIASQLECFYNKVEGVINAL